MASLGISINFNEADLEYARERFREAGVNTPRAFRNVLNRVGRAVRRSLVERAKETYTLKTGLSLASIRLTLATPENLTVKLSSSGEPRTIRSFKTATRKRDGVSVQILKSSTIKSLTLGTAGGRFTTDSEGRITGMETNLVSKAFIAKGGEVAGLVVQRISKARYPLKVLKGPSVPKIYEKVYQGAHGLPGMQEETQQKLHDELLAEVAKIFERRQ